MMKYAGNINDEYRLARVLEGYPDSKGLVRTVKVGYRKRDKREGAEVFWKKPLTEERVAVQRLAKLQAVNEPLVSGPEQADYLLWADHVLAQPDQQQHLPSEGDHDQMSVVELHDKEEPQQGAGHALQVQDV